MSVRLQSAEEGAEEMSRLAQAVQRQVDELRALAKARALKRSRRMFDDDRENQDDEQLGGGAFEHLDEATKTATTPMTAAIDTAAQGEDGDMARKKATKRTRKAKSKLGKKMRVQKVKSVKTSGGRTRKTYRLVDGIPDNIREGSAGQAILKAIQDHGSPTRNELREALPKSFKDNTLRSFLGEFQREKIVASE